jgi:hypothetical protein
VSKKEGDEAGSGKESKLRQAGESHGPHPITLAEPKTLMKTARWLHERARTAGQ